MTTRNAFRSGAIAAAWLLASPWLAAPAAWAADPTIALPSSYVMMTIFLRHDQTKTLAEINKELEASNFYRDFPPAGVEIESWYVMMGVGQVVTLRVPPSQLRELNVAIENRAWKAFRTEFYPTYDYKTIYKTLNEKARAAAPK